MGRYLLQYFRANAKESIRPLAKADFRPPSSPILGEHESKSPKLGGFRGHSRIYARGLL